LDPAQGELLNRSTGERRAVCLWLGADEPGPTSGVGMPRQGSGRRCPDLGGLPENRRVRQVQDGVDPKPVKGIGRRFIDAVQSANRQQGNFLRHSLPELRLE